MSKQIIAVEMEAPEGYELTGEYRQVTHNEYYLEPLDNKPRKCKACISAANYFILRKLAPISRKYAVFKIDWDHSYKPMLETSDGWVDCIVGHKHAGYTIYGFGNSEGNMGTTKYSQVPVSLKANYKYAYGKLEV